jgi:DNA-binding CsgD family transcriptional regulator
MIRTGRPSPAVKRRREFSPHTLPNNLEEAAMRVDLPPGSLKERVSAHVPNESLTRKNVPPSRSAAGFLLMDSSLNPICFNDEATHILSYPDTLANQRRPEVFLAGKIHLTLLTRPAVGDAPFVTEFRSGRRRYFCRAFLVDSQAKDPVHPSVAVLLERGPSGLVPLRQVFQQFNLTQREREVLEYLLQGMSSKVIANRMNLSPNTVKAFLRLIMIKMGVTSRSAIVGKIIMTQPKCFGSIPL